MNKILIPLLLLMAAVLAACRDQPSTPIPPAPSLVPQVLSTPDASPTVPIVATPANFSAATLPPPPTIAPVPTSTSPAEAGPGNDEAGLIVEFGDDRNPLTGELLGDPQELQRRPLSVKLSNAPASYTRPQSGLNDADLVFEHTTEGNLTRFTAVFYGKSPPRIGPIRSARLIDLELPAMYDAALVYSGSSNGVGQRLRAADFSQRILYAGGKGYFRTGEAKPVEHTLYGDPELLWEALDEKGYNQPPIFSTTNVFSDVPPPGGIPSSGLDLDYNWTFVSWRYNAQSGRYLRWADGEEHADGNTMDQVAVANVIALAPNHVFDPTICEQVAADGSCAALSVQIQLWGSGSAVILRDGQRYDVTWHRAGRTDSLTFTDAQGNPFPLKIGNSWVQLVPSWLDSPLTILD